MELSLLAQLAGIGNFIINTIKSISPRFKKWFYLLLSLPLSVGIYYFTLPDEPPIPQSIILDWGYSGGARWQPGNPQSIQGPKESMLTVNGSVLRSLARKNYKLIGVGFHYTISGDVLDQPDVSKSGLYDIRDGHITITIPWNDRFISELVHAQPVGESLYLRPIPNYWLLAVPKGVTPKAFNSFNTSGRI
jgi:hypothetical protein